ncbi:AMP-binding enzyme [Rhodococcus sp. AG1013]|nr:AMP-binding enzyme [Rhodococcus sp. AG1013]
MPPVTGAKPRTLCEAFQSTRRDPPGRRGAPHPRRRCRHHLAPVRRAGPPDRRRSGETRCSPRGHRRHHADQPTRIHLVDIGALHAGATPFSVYNTLAPEQLEYVLTNAGNRVVVCEEQFLPVVREALQGTAVETTVCVDGAPARHHEPGGPRGERRPGLRLRLRLRRSMESRRTQRRSDRHRHLRHHGVTEGRSASDGGRRASNPTAHHSHGNYWSSTLWRTGWSSPRSGRNWVSTVSRSR